MFILLLLLVFLVYLYFNDGGFFIYSKHFEISMSKQKIDNIISKRKNSVKKCSNCGKVIPDNLRICEKCQTEEINVYSSKHYDDSDEKPKNIIDGKYRRF